MNAQRIKTQVHRFFVLPCTIVILVFSSCKKQVVQSAGDNLPPPIEVTHVKDSGNNNLIAWNAPGFSIDDDGIKSAHFDKNLKQGLYIFSNPTLQGGATDITIAGWVKFDSITGKPQVIACKDNDSTSMGSEYYMGYYPQYGSFVFQVESLVKTTNFVVSSIGKAKAGLWYYVVGSYDHINGKVYIEVNNSTKDSITNVAGETHITHTAFTIGCDANSGPDSAGKPHGSFLNGSVASIGFWKRLLTPTEKLSLYNYDPLHSAPNPGTINNTAWTADVPASISRNINSASFDGITSFINTESDIVLGSRNSVSLWFKVNAFDGVFFGNNEKTGTNTYAMALDETTIRVQTDIVSSFKDFTVAPMSLGNWYNLVIIRDSPTTHIYLNGIESVSGGQSQAKHITINQFGKYWNGSAGFFFNGQMADVKIWNCLLPPEEIANLAAGQETSLTPLYYYKLNEGSGLIAHNFGRGLPLLYNQLPASLQGEGISTFISWWNLDEESGMRHDSR